MFEKAKHVYIRTAVFAFNGALFFCFINLVFIFLPDPVEKQLAYYRSLYLSAFNAFETDNKILYEVYPGKSKAEIESRVMHAPNIKSHPVLEYMNEPVQNSCYHLGIENIRYDEMPFNDSVYQAKLNGSVWVLGGSTTFGRGVCSDETITCFLNKIDSNNTYLNLGCQGYNQNNEIDKLVLLLKKGYKPKSVIFIDGLNDLTSLSQYGFEAAETPSGTNGSYAMEFGPDQKLFSKNSLYLIPVVQWYNQYRASKKAQAGLPVEENIYTPQSSYNKYAYTHYLSYKEYIHEANFLLAIKMFIFYQENLQFVRHLAETYHFTFAVFFQPLGMLFMQNPFILNKEEYLKHFYHVKQLAYLQKNMRKQIHAGKFEGFYDITSLDSKCAFPPYIDLTHYSAAMNKLMAKTIFDTLSTP